MARSFDGGQKLNTQFCDKLTGGAGLEILSVYRKKLLAWPQMAPGYTTVGSTPHG